MGVVVNGRCCQWVLPMGVVLNWGSGQNFPSSEIRSGFRASRLNSTVLVRGQKTGEAPFHS